jgi:5-methylcytosine-specific restriction protein A
MLKKLCRCGKLIEYNKKYCNKCSEKIEQYRKEKSKYYDKYKRNKRSTKFYNSKEWIKLRTFVLSKYKGLDLYAYYVDKRIVYASHVHHVIEIEDNWDRRLDINNLIPLSNENHSKISVLYKKDNKIKQETQELLFNLLERWKNEMG